jgi:hypothetical protein
LHAFLRVGLHRLLIRARQIVSAKIFLHFAFLLRFLILKNSLQHICLGGVLLVCDSALHRSEVFFSANFVVLHQLIHVVFFSERSLVAVRGELRWFRENFVSRKLHEIVLL